MKKQLIIFTAAVLALVAALSIIAIIFVNSFYTNEIAIVQNIAGSVLTEYPRAEQNFVDGLNDENLSNIQQGADILSRYGYDHNQQIKYNPAYMQALTRFLLIIGLFGVIALACGFISYRSKIKHLLRQEEIITILLESCLNDDYSFANHQSQLNQLGNAQFADALVKLGSRLQLQTEKLNTEQEKTKALVTDISHQLKTPISALATCFSMYLESDDEQEKAEFLERSLEQMNRLESLTASLINISRLENQMITIQPKATSLSDIIITAINTIYHKAAQKQITITTPDFDDFTLYMDKKWTAEALVNVLDNAIKYSPEGSEITLTINKLYSFVRIEITDCGIGITKDERNRIFSRFFRGSHPSVQNQEGSGVGLYLTRQILEEQGGTVSVRSGAGAGSTFIIQLPL